MHQICQLLKPKANIHQLPEVCRSRLNHLQPYLLLKFKYKMGKTCMDFFRDNSFLGGLVNASLGGFPSISTCSLCVFCSQGEGHYELQFIMSHGLHLQSKEKKK